MAETFVVVLITQRSQVQILPPLPGQRPLPITEGAFYICLSAAPDSGRRASAPVSALGRAAA
jgi:hypothetical protein